MDVSSVIEAVGPRLRKIRHKRGRTLASVAAETHLSISAISRVENGKRQPTLDVLLPLASAYRVALDYLVPAPKTGDPRIHLSPHALAHGDVIVPITQHPGRVQAFKQVLGPRQVRLSSHEGHAWFYVLAGRLRLMLGDDEYVILPGEIVQFDPATPHWFGPADERAVEILHLFGPRGDRPVMRLSHTTESS